MNRVVFTLAYLLATARLLAVELESKEGKKIEADILKADADTVTVRRATSADAIVIQRGTLSLEANEIVDDFLERKSEQKRNDQGFSRYEFPASDEENAIDRLWIKLPRKGLETKAKSIRGVSFLTEDASSCFVGLSEGGDLAKAEEAVNKRKRGFQDTTHRSATAKQLEEFHKVNNIERKKFGAWEGFLLEHHYSGGRSGEIYGAFVSNGKLLRVSVFFDDDKRGVFSRRCYEGLVESVSVRRLHRRP